MKNKVLITLITALLAVSSFLMGKVGVTPAHPLGSVEVSSEYTSTTTGTVAQFPRGKVLQSPAVLASLKVPNANGNVATSAPTILGSVIITQTGTSPFCLYDGTSTVTNGEWATTTIACFPASAVVGTYTFDAQVKKGILFDPTGSVTGTSFASTTFTYR